MEKSIMYNHMTKEMQDVYDETLNEKKLKEEFLYCHRMYERCKKAYETSLPCKSASGEPVTHGAKKVIRALSMYWLVRRDAIKEFLPREWVEEQGISSFIFYR